MPDQLSSTDSNRALTRSLNIFPVVGVGASAGGLAAFKSFLKAIPEASGMAYVLVQHLDPTHESLLPELLQKSTRVPVQEITDEVVVEPDHIYIIPSNKTLISNNGKLELSLREQRSKSQKHLPIDIFFESLAEVHQSHTIGVVLSGNGKDGSLGLKAIKEVGGITFAQDQDSAEFKDMPRNAFQEGVVDFMLPPDEIPEKILEINKKIYREDGEEKELENEHAEVFKQILALLKTRKGTDFTYYKQTTVRRRILRRMALSNKEDPLEYLKFLRANKGEQDVLHQDLLIPVSDFFRDPEIFNKVCKKILPELLKNKPAEEPVRIWVAGCSTGQEVYTIAICLLENLKGKEGKEKIQIFGTDISEKAIAKARMGIYKVSELENLSQERIENFFTRVDGNVQINKQVREMCVFAYHNFLKDPPFGNMDFLSCRNVLIYMQPYLQKKALTTFHYALRPKSYLLLGKSETISSVPDLFLPSEKKDRIFIRKDKPGKFMQVTSKRREENFRDFSKPAKIQNARTDFQKAADELVLNKYTPTGVVIDEAMDIVHFRGHPGYFLEPHPGKASLNLLKMAKPGLAFELRFLVHNAKKDGKPAIKHGIPMEDPSGTQLISIEAIPLPNLTDPHYLILFHNPDQGSVSGKPKSTISPSVGEAADRKNLQIEQLKKELAQAREDMSSISEDQEATNEELQSANEELQSSSEELQSLNEELETSKEELQSTNEELISVNQELVSMNKNLTTANNFAVDVLDSVREPWVVLDKNFRIKSFNNMFQKVFHPEQKELDESSFFELGEGQWDLPEFKSLLQQILPKKSRANNFEITTEISRTGERTLQVNAREVMRDEGGEKLILLVLGDITERRKAERQLEKSEIRFKLLTETLPQLIWVSDSSGKFEYFNPQLKEYTGITSEESLDSQWSSFVHPDDLGKVLRSWKKSLKTGKAFSMEHRLRAKDGTYNWFLAKALPSFNTEGETISWFGSYTNIELQKDAQRNLRKSREHFRQLSELIPEKISHADVYGNVDYFNQSWQEFSGLTEEELKNDGWLELVHTEDRGKAEARWKKSIRTGEPFEKELRFLDKNGDYKWHLSRAIPIKDETGRIKQWIGSTTEVHRIKEEEKRKEGFLKLVSHELKTPVTSIKGYVQLLLSMLQEGKEIPINAIPLRPSLERMDSQIARLTRLISEMLDLSRIEENRLSLKKAPFNLNELVETTVQDLNIVKSIPLVVDQEASFRILADKDRIEQVLINLITNAVKYSTENKEIELRIFESQDNKAAVSVKDHGIGIAEKDQKDIFKRFYRVAGKNEDTYAGLGIGLFLVHEIIERHRGSLTLESKLGEGCTFTFALPYEEREENMT